jgi:hypothetical protein
MKHILFFACLALGVKACETGDGDKAGDIGLSKTTLYFSTQGGLIPLPHKKLTGGYGMA